MTNKTLPIAKGDTVIFQVDGEGETLSGIVSAVDVSDIEGVPCLAFDEPTHLVRTTDEGTWAIHPSWVLEVFPLETDHDTSGMPEVIRVNRDDYWLTVRDAFSIFDGYVIEWGDYVTGYWQESHPTLSQVFHRLAVLVPAIEADTERQK